MLKVLNQLIVSLVLLCASTQMAAAQGGLSFDLIKPKKFEEKKLGSEKTGEKKFGLVRRFTQNGVTKFNYHFNAVQKLELVLARAKAMHKDNYSQLLSFYNYDLTKMEPLHSELDSVIYKANAGILIHDLRNSWVDNLYLLMGMAHYFKNDLDTAYLTFQYINYAFAPKEKDGYDIPIGSNATEGGNAFSISTKEKTDVLTKAWTRPPSRNESFIWQIRTYLAKNEMPEAAGMIETLKNDPLFPDRLRTDLHEVQAYYFYKEQIFDSAAIYLEKSLGNAENNTEKARWEYLIAQLYEQSGDHEAAREFFERSASRTFDPVMEIYARLNAIRQNRDDEKAIVENIEALLKMARKDRYRSYRDIIYFTAANMELERDNVAGARQLLLKATQVPQLPGESNGQRMQAFLLLGDLSFEMREYKDAKRFYDSVDITDPTLVNTSLLEQRKMQLIPIVEEINVLDRQDSLQRIAAMPEKEREAYIKKLVRQIRKSQGIKDEPGESAANNSVNKTTAPSDLFGSSKGEWYFDNASLKSKGFTDFKAKWGNRPNADNWRRSSAISRTSDTREQQQVNAAGEQAVDSASVTELSVEGLMQHLPLTPEQLQLSNDSIESAMFQLGKMYFESLEDYPGTISTLDSLLEKFPSTIHKPEALFILHFCYSKTGNTAKAAEMKQQLEQQYEGSEYQKMVTNPATGTPQRRAEADMNSRYDRIYNSFIEGRFDQALDEKKLADSLYGTNYWTPQLLYIQSVFHVKQRDDEQAKAVLQQIIKLFPNSPLTPRAETMLSVLGRRKEIEEYLSNLKIERPGEDSLVAVTDDQPRAQQQVEETTDSLDKDIAAKQLALGKVATDEKVKKDISTVAPGQNNAAEAMKAAGRAGADSLAALQQRQLAAAKTADSLANVQKLAELAAAKTADSIATAQRLADIAAARTADSLAVIRRADSLAAVKRADSLGAIAGQRMRDSLHALSVTRDSLAAVTRKAEEIARAAAAKTADSLRTVARKAADSARIAAERAAIKSTYSVNDAAPHMVLMILDKVDPVYVGEARNAFDRYNKQAFYTTQMTTSNVAVNDSLNLVVISPFPNAAAALEYTRQTAPIADTRIIPWMPKGKFSFVVITAQNLEILKTRRDITEYLRFHGQAYSGK